jgi:hypothetical protein
MFLHLTFAAFNIFSVYPVSGVQLPVLLHPRHLCQRASLTALQRLFVYYSALSHDIHDEGR